MNSEYSEVFVWIWLPEETMPVVAGKLTSLGRAYNFNYGKSYLQRDNAIAIYDAELPLRPGLIPLLTGLSIPGCLRDAAPDAWGRRVILNKRFGHKGTGVDPAALGELTYFIESGSDRIGALDFQLSPTQYEPRQPTGASLEELAEATERVEKGIPLTEELAQALQHGTSIGGARPKAVVQNDTQKFIAKFSASSDLYSVVKAEFIAMRLAAIAGLNVAPVSLQSVAGKDVLLVERFDRTATYKGWQRKSIVSALTILELDEMMARYASYEILTEHIRTKFKDAPTTLRELFSRLVFNILVGNTDDHARNHAAYWDGQMLSLTPAYDVCPQSRHGQIASQAMLIIGNDRSSRIGTCLEAAHNFLISEEEAMQIVENQIVCIVENWPMVCDEASLSEVDRNLLWGNQILNPFVFDGLESANLQDIANTTNRKQ
ncbi:serine/threonine-protein kinase HipA [Geoalkalibacter ferrihydriticus]|uniref:Phosphatidylinositol kinase n=2 Tax=Geoalkalibacter ferrihydriticus TaxID=392333 RepID=A0A0C2EF35_9BACT|nr:phosphatidylinositol kinase [Geoalkalibacter ferrihydriticus DSM 17813]SDM25075.1 serine/threonine-protein kinase HipA [Geoalkalibacter ferrihydriticus]